MILISTPDYDWLHLQFACPDCDTRVKFELKDLVEVPKISPRRYGHRWTVHRVCPTCGPMKLFQEVQEKEPCSF